MNAWTVVEVVGVMVTMGRSGGDRGRIPYDEGGDEGRGYYGGFGTGGT